MRVNMEYNCYGTIKVASPLIDSYKLCFKSGRRWDAFHCLLALFSDRLLFVVFEFHDKRLNVLSLALPLLNALLGIRVEVFLLLV